MAGLLVGKLVHTGTITFTDHDPGCLQLIEENISLNSPPFSSQLQLNENNSGSTSSSINENSSSSSSSNSSSSSSGGSSSNVKYNVYHLSWGKESFLSTENASFRDHVRATKFPLIIGSDLIYCVEGEAVARVAMKWFFHVRMQRSARLARWFCGGKY